MGLQGMSKSCQIRPTGYYVPSPLPKSPEEKPLASAAQLCACVCIFFFWHMLTLLRNYIRIQVLVIRTYRSVVVGFGNWRVGAGSSGPPPRLSA